MILHMKVIEMKNILKQVHLMKHALKKTETI